MQENSASLYVHYKTLSLDVSQIAFKVLYDVIFLEIDCVLGELYFFEGYVQLIIVIFSIRFKK